MCQDLSFISDYAILGKPNSQEDTYMQNEFHPLLNSVASKCQNHFGKRLIAGYLHGSILYGDAIPGVSDLDYLLVLTSLTDDDKVWLFETAHAVELEYPIAAEVHLSPVTMDDLRNQSFARFALMHNAALHMGQDALSLLAVEGVTIPTPDASFAKGRLDFARHCFQQALRGETPDCTGPLPDENCYILRKFTRYFVVIEGAYYLMSKGLFRSFRSVDVLPALTELLPQHQETLQYAQNLLTTPNKYNDLPMDYIYQIEPLVTEMFSFIEHL